jgi:hypothetical protein
MDFLTTLWRLFLYGPAVLLLDPGRFFSFLILRTVGRTPWTGDYPVVRPTVMDVMAFRKWKLDLCSLNSVLPVDN